MTLANLITIINLSIYQIYFFICYIITIVFSSICFNLMLNFYQQDKIAFCCAAAFMTMIFYITAEASSLLEEVFSAKRDAFIRLNKQ